MIRVILAAAVAFLLAAFQPQITDALADLALYGVLLLASA